MTINADHITDLRDHKHKRDATISHDVAQTVEAVVTAPVRHQKSFRIGNRNHGAIIAAPSYICAPNADIVEYVEEICDASGLAIGFYNNPPRVTTDLSAEAILRLAEHPNIVVNKESTGRVGQAAKLAEGNPDMSLMCCDSPNLGLVVPTMSLGGHGTANMSGNIIPAEMTVISKPWESFEDAENFKNMWLRMLPMLHFTYSAINPVPVKSLMAAVGLPAGPLRKPLTAVSGDHLARGLRIVQDLGLDERYGYRVPDAAMLAAE